MTHNLKEACRQLRLSGLAGSLDLRVQEATSHQLPHVQFLELLLQDELNVRSQRQLERRKKAAGFRDLKPLEDFDWGFNPSIKRSQVFDLATGQFIRQHRASAKAFSLKLSATLPFAPASWCSIARFSIWLGI